MEKNRSMASVVSTTSTTRRSLQARGFEESDEYDVNTRSSGSRAKFNDDAYGRGSQSSYSISQRPSVARIKYQSMSRQSEASPQPRRQSMAARVSIFMGTGINEGESRSSLMPRKSVVRTRSGEINDLPRRSVVGMRPVQLAMESEATQPSRRRSSWAIRAEMGEVDADEDTALDPHRENQWLDEKEKLHTREQKKRVTEINLFGRGQPCCKVPHGPVACDPTSRNEVVARKSIVFAGPEYETRNVKESLSSKGGLNIRETRGERESLSSNKYGMVGKNCPSASCKDKSRPDWVDGHEFLHNTYAETTEYSSYGNNFEDGTSSFAFYPGSRGSASSHYSIRGSYKQGSMHSEDERSSASSTGSRFRDDSVMGKVKIRKESRYSKGASISSGERGSSKYSSRSSKSGSKSSKTGSIGFESDSRNSKSRRKSSKGGKKVSKSKKNSKFKSKTSQTEDF